MTNYPTHLIEAPRPEDDKVTYENGNTDDIIKTVLFGDTRCAFYTKKFAKAFRGKQLLDTCRNIWEFVKQEIPYKLDPGGHQYIKSPGRLWQEKSGDCKSFSVFTASILKNLGIEYGYRFASYKTDDPTPTHVYIYVPVEGAEIIIDAVWNGPFNTQKKFDHKQDHLMAKIAYLGSTGIGNSAIGAIQPSPPNPNRGRLVIGKHYDQITDGELSLLLARQKIEIDQDNARHLGSTHKDQGYQRMLDVVNHALNHIDNPDVINGLGDHFLGSAGPDEIGKLKIGKFFKKVGEGIKKVTKAVTKVATLPMRLLGKAAMEIWLPKAAPAFLYIFTADAIVSKLPDKMKRKRDKAVKLKDFICKTLGMKEPHFMGIIRNNLTKRFKQSPEAHLADQLKKAGISGLSGVGKILKKKIVNKRRIVRPQPVSTLVSQFAQPSQLTQILPGDATPNIQLMPQDQREAAFEEERQKAGMPSGFSKVGTGIEKVGQKVGGLWGGIIQAVGWLISKLGGKKKGVEFSTDDVPDVVSDAANAFQFKDLAGNYSGLDGNQKTQVRDFAAQLIDEDATGAQAYQKLNSLDYLNDAQRKEIASEVEEGYEPIDTDAANQLALDIKKSANLNPERNGGGTAGFCQC
ncbi:MAG: transglutaminase-like domain-containing protein [Bacteroidota bacterium]